ncbi:MAG: glycosyltransferase [Pseudomonadota bacterium]
MTRAAEELRRLVAVAQRGASPRPSDPPEYFQPDEGTGVALTVVVPCFNEEDGLPYLAGRLARLVKDVTCRVSFVLVDDGSTDGTWAVMDACFGDWSNVRCVRHERNRGIAAASMTGIRAAEDEMVAVIDSDCSYDPARVVDMIPLLGPDVAMVTASPYHADGGVVGVPEWRLVLSKGASWAYRRLLRNKLATYTSCFRLYRKSAVEQVALRHPGFAGVAETLAALDLAGARIVELPIVLETRIFGQSKLRFGGPRWITSACCERSRWRGSRGGATSRRYFKERMYEYTGFPQ